MSFTPADKSRPASRSHRHRDDDERSHKHRDHHHHRKHDHTRHDNAEHSTRKRKRTPSPPLPDRLPLGAQRLSKNDLEDLKPLFASYLDIQKQLFLEDLTEDEVKGRWKSFVHKWNRGQLAEGWYDPSTKRKALESFEENAASVRPPPPERPHPQPQHEAAENDLDLSDSDDDYGPVLPTSKANASSRAIAIASRPTAPSFSDLALRDEQSAEDASAQRSDLQYSRKLDRKAQKERLDELVPRAEPGTRERQLEKKAEKAATVREFKDAKGNVGDMAEVGESELMGGDDGGVEGVKRMKKEAERKRTEREQRKLEVLQARAVEREERLAVVREKETKTMEMLKAIARERFE